MTEIQVGKVMLTPKGEYDSTKTYTRLDAVTYQGSSYVCLADTSSTPPSDSWQLLAGKGATGDVGPQGPQGVPGPQGPKGDAQDPGFYHYTVDLTDTKYDRNKWYYVNANGYQLGSLGGPSYFSLEAPLDATTVPYGKHGSGSACARQTVFYFQSDWDTYTRKMIVLDDQNPTLWTTDGKRLLTFAVPSDNDLNYAFYARGGLKINITSDVSGLVWTPQTDTLVTNGTTIPVLNDAPDPKALGLDDDSAFWALPMSQLKQQLRPSNTIDSSSQDTIKKPSDYPEGFYREIKSFDALGLDKAKIASELVQGKVVWLTTKKYSTYARQTAEVIDGPVPATFFRNGSGDTWSNWLISQLTAY